MFFRRRQLLRTLTFAFGSGVLAGRKGPGLEAQTTPKPPPPAPAGPAPAAAGEKEKVTGIGGLFFRAHDPDALARWYEQHLGVSPTPTSYGGSPWRQQAGVTVFAPFAEKTGYFGDPSKMWMVNFRVRDLNLMVAQLEAAGIAVKMDPQVYPNGRFARIHDPEGNPIELWQPA